MVALVASDFGPCWPVVLTQRNEVVGMFAAVGGTNAGAKQREGFTLLRLFGAGSRDETPPYRGSCPTRITYPSGSITRISPAGM